MIGYYLPQYNFSVRFHNGSWCMFCRQPEDVEATELDQIDAVRYWANANRRKFDELRDENTLHTRLSS